MSSYPSKFTVRTNPTLLRAFCYVAKYNERSGNQELVMLMKKHVAEYEKQHGKIKFDEE